ncbi:MAG TPA: hypothetical protein VJ464_21515 [Blastocatellia bacterium]|nr:hypothetical protein [Blastocatellia bacterium]
MATALLEKMHTKWNTHKKITILISVFTVVILALQAIYNLYQDRWREIEFLKSEIVTKREENSKRADIPRISLTVNTLERTGLSKQMLENLNALPSTIEIKHVAGGTAKGLRLDIHCDKEIIKYQKWQGPEDFLVSKLGSDNKTLRLEAPQIRKEARIGLTVLTKELPAIETDYLLETGDIINVSTYDDRRNITNEDAHAIILGGSGGTPPSESEAIARLPLTSQIQLLEGEIKDLRSQTFFIWFMKKFGDWLAVFILLGVLGAYFVPTYRRDKEKRSKREETIQGIKAGQFKNITPTDLLYRFGQPDHFSLEGAADDAELKLTYFCHYEFGKRTKGILFHFRKQRICNVTYEDGLPIL